MKNSVSSNINFKNFSLKIKNLKITQNFKLIVNKDNKLLESLTNSYRYSYTKKIISKYKKNSHFTIIGMGGSILGSEAIYDFLKHKIKKKFNFISNLNNTLNSLKKKL